MSGKTVPSAIALLVFGNIAALISDMIIKGLGQGVPVFQFVFLRTVCAVLLLVPMLPWLRRSDAWSGIRLNLLRAHIGLFGISCMVVALNTLPLATANALFYAAPVLVMVITVVFLRETLKPLSLIAVVSGFVGIIVILRPVALSWASFSAIGVALALALNVILVRKLPTRQSPLYTLIQTNLFMLPAVFLLTLWEGAPFSWTVLLHALGSALFILCYNGTVLMAYRWVSANQVSSAEYTGLIWAILGGWIVFGEVPDAWFIVGASLIVLPLMALGWAHRRRRPARVTPQSREVEADPVGT